MHPSDSQRSQNTPLGISGYTYFWNEGKPTPFEWYIHQGFDTVEINASFYRFPSPSWVASWLRAAPSEFDFSIKVHRSITHYSKLRGKALDLWGRFSGILQPLKGRICFWLFQMPPNYTPTEKNIECIRDFFQHSDLGNTAVLEFRHEGWWKKIDALEETGVAFTSVDAPYLPAEIVTLNDVVYVRLHGRTAWYDYVYSEDELRELLVKIRRSSAKMKYIYLNNNHGMLENGRFLMSLVRRGAASGVPEQGT